MLIISTVNCGKSLKAVLVTDSETFWAGIWRVFECRI